MRRSGDGPDTAWPCAGRQRDGAPKPTHRAAYFNVSQIGDDQLRDLTAAGASRPAPWHAGANLYLRGHRHGGPRRMSDQRAGPFDMDRNVSFWKARFLGPVRALMAGARCDPTARAALLGQKPTACA